MASNSMHQKSMRFLALQAQYNQRVYTCSVSFAMPNRIFRERLQTFTVGQTLETKKTGVLRILRYLTREQVALTLEPS